MDREHWSKFAAEWIGWARAPNHDAFWAYRDSLIGFVGRGHGRALDLGCGEGRVSRAVASCGYRLTAVDPVRALVDAAVAANSARDYAVATATSLPFKDGCFDLVLAYNVLMDVEDLEPAVKEIRRVMSPSGRFLMSIVHPFADRGAFASSDGEAPFVLKGSYFGRQRFEGVEDRAGIRMHFAGWSRPLEAYATALEQAGLAITALREPRPDFRDGRDRMRQWTRVPLFLWLEARPASF
jgi:SAM-dependent methyltransferase